PGICGRCWWCSIYRLCKSRPSFRPADDQRSLGSPEDSSPWLDSVSCATASLGIARCSESQAPRSIRRQRSLQNGRKGDVDQSISRLQVGHLTRGGLISCAAAENERHVLLRLRRARRQAIPFQKSHTATVVAT